MIVIRFSEVVGVTTFFRKLSSISLLHSKYSGDLDLIIYHLRYEKEFLEVVCTLTEMKDIVVLSAHSIFEIIKGIDDTFAEITRVCIIF